MAKRTSNTYWAALALLMAETVYTLGWVVQDLGIRSGFWPEDPVGEQFIASTTVWHETAFFAHATMNAVALVLLISRRKWALHAFLVAFLLGRVDWIYLTSNQPFDYLLSGQASLVGFVTFALHGVLIGLLVLMVFNKQLR